MRQTQHDRYENWLAYSPLVYNYLALHQMPNFTQIKDIRWVRAVKPVQSIIKKHTKYLLMSGAKDIYKSDKSNSTVRKGLLSFYELNYPYFQQLDDTRLNPKLIERKSWIYKYPITVLEQLALEVESPLQNCFLTSFEEDFRISILPIENITIQQKYKDNFLEDSPKLVGHQNKVTKISWGIFQQDSPVIVSSSVDGSALVWDVHKLEKKQQLLYHRTAVNDVCLIHNKQGGDWFDHHQSDEPFQIGTAGMDGFILLWEERQKLPIAKINCKQKEIYSIACISKECILSGGSDGTIKFWDLKAAKEYTYKSDSHSQKITSIKVHPKFTTEEQKNKNNAVGKVAFSSSGNDGKIISWQEKAQFIHEGHQSEINSYDRLESENLFASVEKSWAGVMIWQNGVTLGQLQS